MLKVFISFHKDLGGKEATALRDHIVEKFPLARVFLSIDPDSKETGTEWERQIYANLHDANVFVAVIDKQWIHKLHKPESVVRREIECALWNPNIKRHFPYRLKDVETPSRGDLPVSVRDLMRVEFFQDKVEQVLAIDPSSPAEPTGAASTASPTAEPAQWKKLEADLRSIEAELARSNELPVAFVSSALALRTSNDSLAFFSMVVTEIVHQARRENRLPMQVVLKVPEWETAEAAEIEQKRILDDVFSPKCHSYRAIILAPYQVEPLRKQVERFLDEHKGYPLFTIDQCFFLRKWENDCVEEPTVSVNLPSGVTADWKMAGELAADCVAAYLKQTGVAKPLVWTFTGTTGMEARHKSFEKHLKTKFADCVIHFIRADFQQDEAKKQLVEMFNQQECLPHIIYCTNDEMALGVCDGLDDIRNSFPRPISSAGTTKLPGGTVQVSSTNLKMPPELKEDPTFGVKVVGFDGIHDMTTHLSPPQDPTRKHRHILNTIDVRVREQVRRLLDMIVEYIRTPSDSREIRRIDPKLYVTAKIQHDRIESEMLLDSDKWTAFKTERPYTSSATP